MLDLSGGMKAVWERIDFSGAFLLVVALSIQLVGLSLGGNDLPWGSPWVVASLVGSFALLAAFILVEAKTTAIPIIPLKMLRGRIPVAVQISNVCVGLAAYAVRILTTEFRKEVLSFDSTCSCCRYSSKSS